MLLYCYKCLAVRPFDDVIPIGGKKLQCSECGYEYTLYPSKVIIGNFREYVFYHTDLSGRALSIIWFNISSVNEFFQLTLKDFLGFRYCGQKTANKLIEFKKTLHKNLGYTLNETKLKKESDLITIPIFLKNDSEFFEAALQKLSKKNYELFVRKYKIDSLAKFMALQTENLISIKKCDSKTIEEIRLAQNTIIEIIKIIESRNDLRFNDFKSMLKLDKNIRDLLHIEVDVDPDKPFPSLNKWILSISKGSERNKNVFMLRMGMHGKRPQTNQQIAIEHNISRERVRAIIEKMKRTGQTPIYRLGLNPLIERAEKILRSAGGKMTFSDLNTHLLCYGPQGELLKYALPFIEYLIGFPSWQKAGLSKKESIVYIETDLNE